MSRAAFVLPDPVSGTEYHIYAAEPDSRHGPIPAVLFMDGDDQFAAAVKGYGAARGEGRVPDLLLVGVGYGASYTKPANRRVRDYTPTPLATEAGSGGADAFLGFLSDRLWPELRQRYAIEETQRGLAGHSLGSLLVVHALLQRPLFFQRFLASAPSLWWNDGAIFGAVEQRQDSGAAAPGRVFLSLGENDTESMTNDLARLERQLAAKPLPELAVVSRRFPGKDHYNVLEEAFATGLAALYGAGRA